MSVVKEFVNFPSEGGFRVLHWSRGIGEVWDAVSPHEHHRICSEGAHWHYHRFLELTLFDEGCGTRFVGDSIENFYSGDLVLLGESLPHYWKTHQRSSGVCVQWEFPSTHPFWALPGTEEISSFLAHAARGIHFQNTTARRLSILLHRLLKTTGSLSRFAILVQLIAEAMSAPDSDQHLLATRAFIPTQNSAHHARIREVIRYILVNYRDQIGMDALLQITRMSKPTFCRQFKRHTGMTFGTFIQEVRLNAACRELTTNETPIIDVAFLSGFSQISFFNRLFKRRHGCSPSTYRLRAANNRVHNSENEEGDKIISLSTTESFGTDGTNQWAQ